MEYIQLGFDLVMYQLYGILVPIMVSLGHAIVVGSSGSGKSTALLYWIADLIELGVELYIADFKRSNEFIGITPNHAEYTDCVSLIGDYYKLFDNTPEGGDIPRVLIIDEIAGLLSHLSLSKDGKQQADDIRMMMSEILMLGRSRRCYLWLSMQRYTATIFPSASGAADNFHSCIGLGRLTVDSRRGLFGSEHLEHENELVFGQGKGIALLDGSPLCGIIIPNLDKSKLLWQLQRGGGGSAT